MANTKQSTKRARQTQKHEQHNAGQRTAIRTSIKKVLKAFQSKDGNAAKDLFQKTVSILDKAASHHIIHHNKASRLKSRLHTKLKNIFN